MLPQAGQVRIAGQPFEIVKPQVERLLQGGDGLVEISRKRVTAGEIILDRRIVRPKLGELFVNFETGDKFAAPRVVIPQDLQRFHKGGITPDYSLHKTNLHVQVLRFLAAQFLTGTVF